MSKQDFKIIAIRPLFGCAEKFLKVLTEDEYYYFYNDYEFHEDSIINEPKEDFHLFTTNKPVINISAVVGKNGAGKSSLMELLYVAFFNLSFKARLLPKLNEDEEEIKYEDGLRVDIYFKFNNAIRKVRIFEKEIEIKNLYNPTTSAEIKDFRKELEDLFYTIAINYSHYALNSNHLGDWVKNIFHKNDGYQTPLVLNPFRKNGNININNEEYLTKSRLLSNIVYINLNRNNQLIRKQRTIVPGKVATDIKFIIDHEKVERINKQFSGNSKLQKNSNEILQLVYDILIGKTFEEGLQNSETEIVHKYIINKLYNISNRYAPYNKDFQFLERQLNKKKLLELLTKIKNDPSHVAFKLNQAINFLKSPSVVMEKLGKWITLSELNKRISSLTNSKSRVIDFIPPSFFVYDLKFENKETFNSLSSGEKQNIYSSSTYKYHLYNLDSISESSVVKYKAVNIVFDEIELYYHPEMQRSFVNDFIESINSIGLKNIHSINCILLTHSPFILSDIPSESILYLKVDPNTKKAIQNSNSIQSFGANIHDILAYSFFDENGLIGGFAQKKISQVLEWLKRKANEIKGDKFFNIDAKFFSKEINQSYVKSMIDLIDEPIIKHQLQKMYFEFVNDNDYIDKEIEKLNKMRR